MDTDILFDYPSLFRVYKSGRVERSPGTTAITAAGHDDVTGVTSRDILIDPANVAARLYIPCSNNDNTKQEKLPVLVYFHGGAFCVYSAFSPKHHAFLNSLVSRAGLIAVSVNYRLAPEDPLPAAYEDSWAALRWAFADSWLAEHGDFERVFLAGESAGGNIAHRMATWAGEGSTGAGAVMRIEGMALVHPFFWGRGPDQRRSRFIEELWRVVNSGSGERGDIDDPWIDPMAESLSGLGCGRVLVCVAEKDVLAERGRAYCEALRGSGWVGEVEVFESEGEGHCFHLDDPDGVRALELMGNLVGFLHPVR